MILSRYLSIDLREQAEYLLAFFLLGEDQDWSLLRSISFMEEAVPLKSIQKIQSLNTNLRRRLAWETLRSYEIKSNLTES